MFFSVVGVYRDISPSVQLSAVDANSVTSFCNCLEMNKQKKRSKYVTEAENECF